METFLKVTFSGLPIDRVSRTSSEVELMETHGSGYSTRVPVLLKSRTSSEVELMETFE